MTDRIYVIGDIHGYLDKLQEALHRVEQDGGPDAQIVFIGDLVDRGPDSRGVIQHLMEGQQAGSNWVTLMGNHDRLFLRFMQNGEVEDSCIKSGVNWIHERLGGLDTLRSYGVNPELSDNLNELHTTACSSVPLDHIAFLRGLDLSCDSDTHFFAHAGIRPGVPLDEQTEDDLLWIRQEFHAFTDPHPKMIVHGHTPVDMVTRYDNRINVDGGTGYGRPLIPMVIEGQDTWLLTEFGRSRL